MNADTFLVRQMAIKNQNKKSISSKLIDTIGNQNGERVFDPVSFSCDKLNLGEQMVEQTRVGVATSKT